MKDALGKDIYIGDLLAVAKASGRSNATQVIGFLHKLPLSPGGRMSIRQVKPTGWKNNTWYVSVEVSSNRIIKLDPDSFDWPEGWERED